MTLKARITEDMKTAMRAKDAARLSTIRMLLAAIKQREVDERIELTDADVLVGDREDAEAAQGLDRAVRGGHAARTLRRWSAPRSPCCRPTCRRSSSDAEIDAEIAAAMAATGRLGMAGMGKVMAVLKPKLAGRADMGAVSAEVKAKLAG